MIWTGLVLAMQPAEAAGVQAAACEGAALEALAGAGAAQCGSAVHKVVYGHRPLVLVMQRGL